jgi:hypothetical protein
MRLRALGLLAVLLTGGCYSKITAYEGNFTLGYESMVQIENFVKPIAPGAKVDLHVFANGENEQMPILEASSSKPGVVKIEQIKGSTLVVKGVSPGVAELTVAARIGGKRVQDKMFFHVAKPTIHSLEHSCTEAKSATYVRGSDVLLFHSLSTPDKRAVIGYDYTPVAISPPSVLDLIDQPQAGGLYHYTAKKAAESVSVTSEVDGSKLDLRVIEPGDIKEAQLIGPDKMIAGTVRYVFARTKFGAAPVCSQNQLTRAKSLTPEICKVTAKLDDSLDDTNRDQLAEVTGLKYGTCKFEVTLPELAGGKGLTLTRSIPIGKVEYPSDGRFRRIWEIALAVFSTNALLFALLRLRRLRRAAR